MLVVLYKTCEVHFRLFRTPMVIMWKQLLMKYLLLELALSSEPQMGKFHVVDWQTTSKNSTKKRVARAARLFFLIQPIK